MMPPSVAVVQAGWLNSLPEFRPAASLLAGFVTKWTKGREPGHDGHHVSVGRSAAAPARRGFLRRARQLPQHAVELVRGHWGLGLQYLAGRHLHRQLPAPDGGTAEAHRCLAARDAGRRPARPTW